MAEAAEFIQGVIRRRIPRARNVAVAYLVCLVPIQAWSIFAVLHEIPAWQLQLGLWDLLAAVSYTQALVLLESVVVFLPLVLAAVILPPPWYRDRFVPLTTGIVYLSAAWFVLAHLHEEALRTWGIRHYLPWVAAYGLSVLALVITIHRSERVRALLGAFVNRLALLAGAYLLVALGAVVIVVARNL
jgi:hypothetical protein